MTATLLPTTGADPFSPDVLEDPGLLHAWLRDAGAVVHLQRYDVSALARYEHVRAALADWQGLQSAAGSA